MLSSLRSRLLLLVVVVSVVAVGATAAIAQQVATDDLRETLDRRLQTRIEVVDALNTQIVLNGSWAGIPDTVGELSNVYGERIAILDEFNRVVADSDPGAELPRVPAGVVGNFADPFTTVDDSVWEMCESQALTLDGSDADLEMVVNEQLLFDCVEDEVGQIDIGPVGLVYVGTGAGDAASVLGPNGPNRRLVVVAVLVLLGAIGVMALALRSVLAPIGALRRGALRLEGGDLESRVPETGATELAELARSFNSMAAALQEDKERQQRWTSDTAHELRNPVQNLRGHLEAAKDGLMPLDDKWLDSVLDEVGQLGYLVADLAVLTLSDAGRIELDRRSVDLRSMIDDVVAAHQPRASHAGVTLTAAGSGRADADERRLRQAVSNLVDNALRHTGRGGSVAVAVGETVGGVELTVTDTGDGIPSDARDRIFDRFARVDEHRARHLGGTGLGLSIVSALVEAHGGEISVDSEVGVGTVFRIVLPAVSGTVAANTPEAEVPRSGPVDDRVEPLGRTDDAVSVVDSANEL